jgi:hypothetical protein
MAEGDYLAFIDDDEFPAANWLLLLFTTCREYKADGVLGPVLRHFEQKPPEWLLKSRFFIRPIYPTGLQVAWHDSRTSNVLVRRETVLGTEAPFRPQFRAGEDQDFFRRKIEQGFRFVWSDEAVVYETIPPNRWTRVYQVRRALLQGACEVLQPSCDAKSILKSVIAVPIYAVSMLVALPFGQHHFVSCGQIAQVFRDQSNTRGVRELSGGAAAEESWRWQLLSYAFCWSLVCSMQTARSRRAPRRRCGCR